MLLDVDISSNFVPFSIALIWLIDFITMLVNLQETARSGVNHSGRSIIQEGFPVAPAPAFSACDTPWYSPYAALD